MQRSLKLAMASGEGADRLVDGRLPVYSDVLFECEGQENVCLASCLLPRSPSWHSDRHPLTAGLLGDEDELR